MVFFSTINKTQLAKFFTIDIAESSFMGIVDPGTHSFDKYVSPEVLSRWLVDAGFQIDKIQGISYIPFVDHWTTVPFTALNYLLSARKI